jgi:hypothetical protein
VLGSVEIAGALDVRADLCDVRERLFDRAPCQRHLGQPGGGLHGKVWHLQCYEHVARTRERPGRIVEAAQAQLGMADADLCECLELAVGDVGRDRAGRFGVRKRGSVIRLQVGDVRKVEQRHRFEAPRADRAGEAQRLVEIAPRARVVAQPVCAVPQIDERGALLLILDSALDKQVWRSSAALA